MTHTYADTQTREETGLAKIIAISDAKAYAKKTGKETLVYFKRYDQNLFPPDRYDWCTEWTAMNESWPDGDRIRWSSSEGYYD